MRRYKKKSEFSYTSGIFPTIELLENKSEVITKVIVTQEDLHNSGIMKIVQICEYKSVPLVISKRKDLAQDANIYAKGIFRKYGTNLSQDSHILLINPEDMGNLGTIIRTLLALNIKNIGLIRPAIDIFNPKVIRASMGGLFKINFEYFDDLLEYKDKYHTRNLYAFVTQGGNVLEHINFQKPYTLMFGAESSGLKAESLVGATKVTLYQSGEVDSLPLPIAVALGVWGSR